MEVDTFAVPLEAGDKLLPCSDGLWEMVYNTPIRKLISIPMVEPSQTIEVLVRVALEAGGRDNVSVIVAFVS